MDKYGVKQCPNTALLEVKADSFLVKTQKEMKKKCYLIMDLYVLV